MKIEPAGRCQGFGLMSRRYLSQGEIDTMLNLTSFREVIINKIYFLSDIYPWLMNVVDL